MLAEQSGIFKLHVGPPKQRRTRRSEQLNIDAPRLEAIVRKTFHRVPAMRNA
ncbi:hypothetical protein ALO83_102809 [Pseudomonas cannabina pv. alisalensis]|nr:Unknown protein sequence [Pseudomonas syringae pv. maculicola]KPW25318.1 hypothetical protein ALO83_102809 [Pseudomonas cannabina pv. alisalensis]